MRFIKILLLLGVLFYFSSCAPMPPPRVQPPEIDYVTASWYGTEFHGRPTSSGEIFNMYALTAAHKELSFGTKLRVTNLRNNKSVIVTVNDRGPFIPGRDLDLSYAAAREIGLIGPGVERVKIEYLGRDMRYAKMVGFAPIVAVGPFTIQVGSFAEEFNAHRLKQGLELRYGDVYITTTYLNGKRFYRVRIGTFHDRDSAYSFARDLAEEGYNTFITKKD
jgi:rare lipoprotein A